jgi:hypothetical protein
MPGKSAKIDQKLARAILNMPQSEKDKLLLRLLRKEPMLLEKMRNDFFSSQADIEGARAALKHEIETRFSDERYASYHHSPGLTMMEMRDFAGAITRHAKTTRDQVGEVELLLTLIDAPLRYLQPMLMADKSRADSFAKYCCRKMQVALEKLEKLKPPQQAEFQLQVNQCLELLRAYPPTAARMSEYGLP